MLDGMHCSENLSSLSSTQMHADRVQVVEALPGALVAEGKLTPRTGTPLTAGVPGRDLVRLPSDRGDAGWDCRFGALSGRSLRVSVMRPTSDGERATSDAGGAR